MIGSIAHHLMETLIGTRLRFSYTDAHRHQTSESMTPVSPRNEFSFGVFMTWDPNRGETMRVM